MGVSTSVLRRQKQNSALDRYKETKAELVHVQRPTTIKQIPDCCYCKQSSKNRVAKDKHVCEGMKSDIYR